MKLRITRNQADVKGLFGGHKGVAFSLHARAEVSPDERKLIDHYKVGDYTLATYEDVYKGQPFQVGYSVNDLINGKNAELTSVSSLLALEDSIKNGCRNLKDLLSVMSTFGGEQEIEI